MSADIYQNPLVERYASRAMVELWSPATRHATWRSLWAELASVQRELGLEITSQQVEALRRAAREPVDLELVRAREREIRHDVMAHVHALGAAAPEARGIIHLGATSCFVTDNADLILMRRGLQLLRTRLASCIRALADFARRHRDLPVLGSTHLQPAQPTTAGKRACLWIQDLLIGLEELEYRCNRLRLRGAKGTTGTQDSYLTLFRGNPDRVAELDQRIATAFGFPETYPVTGQTYPRVVDSQVLGALGTVAQGASKMATDIRILSMHREVEEPREARQVGSSAMAYKRNPMRCERICSLARYVLTLQGCAGQTAATQMLERTLDDSASRRLILPEAFLATDGILRLVHSVARGLVVHPAVIRRRLAAELPFLSTERILMAAVRAGGDRQELHERIRQHAAAAQERVLEGDGTNDLLERLEEDAAFALLEEPLASFATPEQLVGRAPAQVDAFLNGVVTLALAAYQEATGEDEGEIEV